VTYIYSDLINFETYRQSVGPFGSVISPVVRPLHAENNTNAEETRTNIYALSGIRTHDPSVWAGEDISCLIPRGHCNRHSIKYKVIILDISIVFVYLTKAMDNVEHNNCIINNVQLSNL
jgi:hypothetical protein